MILNTLLLDVIIKNFPQGFSTYVKIVENFFIVEKSLNIVFIFDVIFDEFRRGLQEFIK